MARMRRREVLKVLCGAAMTWPVVVRAQQGERVRRVGVLMSTGERDPETQLRLGAFREGLQKLGWAEGRNLHIDYRWGGGSMERTLAYAVELVALKPEVILVLPRRRPWHCIGRPGPSQWCLPRCPILSGSAWLTVAAGRKHHRLCSLRIRNRVEMAGTAQPDCATRRPSRDPLRSRAADFARIPQDG
jgi:hypothetical protein